MADIILTGAAGDADDRPNLTQVLRERVAALGGVELEIPSRSVLSASLQSLTTSSSPSMEPRPTDTPESRPRHGRAVLHRAQGNF